MQCLKVCLAGLALLAAQRGSYAAPPHAAVFSRPQDKRSVADPHADLRRLAGLDGVGGPADYFGHGAAYFPENVVPLPLATVGFDGFGFPAAQHFDLAAAAAATAGFTAFQYPFGFDAGRHSFPQLGTDVPSPRHLEPQQQQQQQQETSRPAPEPAPQPSVPDLALELRPPPFSAPSKNAYAEGPVEGSAGVAGNDLTGRQPSFPTPAQSGTDVPSQRHPEPQQQQQQQQQQETPRPAPEPSVPDLALELRPPPYSAPSENTYAEGSAEGLADAQVHDYESSATPPPREQPTRGHMVIVVSNSLYGGQSDDPLPPPAYANSNTLSATTYGESNSVQPDPVPSSAAGYYGSGPKVVPEHGADAAVASNSIYANGKRESPTAAAVRDSSPRDDDGRPDVTPRD